MFDSGNFWSPYSLLLRVSFIWYFFGSQVIFNDWKFSVTELIFCHETSLLSRTSFLILDGGEGVLLVPCACPKSERWNALGARLPPTTWSFYKTGTSQSMMFSFILGTSFVNLNQSAEDCSRFVPINKINV